MTQKFWLLVEIFRQVDIWIWGRWQKEGKFVLYFCICVFLYGVAEANHSCQERHLPRIKLSDKRDPGHLDLERRRRVTDRRRVFVPTFPQDWDLIRLLLLFLGRCQPITGCPPPKTPALPSIMSTNTKTHLQKNLKTSLLLNPKFITIYIHWHTKKHLHKNTNKNSQALHHLLQTKKHTYKKTSKQQFYWIPNI